MRKMLSAGLKEEYCKHRKCIRVKLQGRQFDVASMEVTKYVKKEMKPSQKQW